MASDIIRLDTIHELHHVLGLPKPRHTLVSLIDAADVHVPAERVGTRVSSGLYSIALKDGSCGLSYGRNAFDFTEGVMVFTAPGQSSTVTEAVEKGSVRGWILYVHPELLRGFPLARVLPEYGFFHYDVFEALHLSEDEERYVERCARNIEAEYHQRVDVHSRRVIVANLELLLAYAQRFYDRQFHSRGPQGHDVAVRFERALQGYFEREAYREEGIPSIQRFAEEVHLSPHYLSDLLKRETGRTAKDHINAYVVEHAKQILLDTDRSVSEVAYALGFNYPHYFTRLFKTRTGMTPVQFRSANGAGRPAPPPTP